MKRFLFFIIILFCFLSFSCENALLPSPNNIRTTESLSSSSDTWLPPSGLTATQGQKSKITLNWESLPGAIRYQIYSSSSPYEQFTQIGETNSSKTTFTHNVSSGVSLYYKITAVNSLEEETSFSSIVLGTSLAKPVISSIEPTSANSDSDLTVSWWMSNVSEETYLKNVIYDVTCSDSNGKVVGTQTIYGSNTSDTSCTFSNLGANTNYYFNVEVCLLSNQNTVEKSDTVDSKTARRLRPNPPENVSATYGTLLSSVELSFTLPSLVDVSLGNNTYEQKPLYFTISRKSETESDYTVICSYLGSVDSNKATSNGTSLFTYTAGETIQYTDSSVVRGVEYEYCIQSYADDISRVISSDLSKSCVKGRAMSVPSFSTQEIKVEIDDKETSDLTDDKYTSMSLPFAFSWDTYGNESSYKFVLEEVRYKLEIDNGGTPDTNPTTTISLNDIDTIFDTIEDVNEFIRTFDLSNPETLSSTRGYYQYKLYIVSTDESDIANTYTTSYLDKVLALGRILVTDDTNKPVIENFKVTDGYSDKFIISWKYDSTITYSIDWQTVNSDGTISEEKHTISASDLETTLSAANNGDIVNYTDSAECGEARKYTLNALRNITVSETLNSVSKTLGKPQLSFTNADYDSITVSWNEVQKASSYSVYYQYEGGEQLGSAIIKDFSEDGVTKSENGIISYVFKQPSGYDDALVSGKKVKVHVAAVSDTIENEKNVSVSNEIDCCTLGPALINTSVTQSTYYDKILLSWSKNDYASGYYIIRKRFIIDESGNAVFALNDLYYLDAATLTLTANGDSVSSGANVKYDNSKYTLTDSYSAVKDSSSQYQVSQSLIPWGVPYDYIVLPVRSSDDQPIIDSETGTITVDKNTYKNLDSTSITKRGSATGYGMNIKAGKADSTSVIKLTWNKPSLSSTVSPRPVIYRREPSSNQTWTRMSYVLNPDAQEYSITPTDNERCSVYEYAVLYDNGGTIPSFVPSYEQSLESSIDPSSKEQFNKGYLFSLPGFAASMLADSGMTEGYTEQVSWDLYDFTKRANGPTTYTVYTKNLNNSAAWYPIASFTNDTASKITIIDNASNGGKDWYDVVIQQSGNGLTIRPKYTSEGGKIDESKSRIKKSDGTAVVTAGCHDGLLKVQRDYKHYYKIEATRTNSDGETITATLGAFDGTQNGENRADKPVYAYRKITDDEWVKCVTLIVADALHQAGGSDNVTIQGITGSLSTYNESKVIYYNFYFNTSGLYKHIFTKTPGSDTTLSSGFSLSVTDYNKGCANSTKVYCTDWTTIDVSSEIDLPSYSGTLYLYSGKGKESIFSSLDVVYNLSLRYKRANSNEIIITDRSDTTYDSNYENTYTAEKNKTSFEQWFPFALGVEMDYKNGSGISDSFPTCNGLWWEVQE